MTDQFDQLSLCFGSLLEQGEYFFKSCQLSFQTEIVKEKGFNEWGCLCHQPQLFRYAKPLATYSDEVSKRQQDDCLWLCHLVVHFLYKPHHCSSPILRNVRGLAYRFIWPAGCLETQHIRNPVFPNPFCVPGVPETQVSWAFASSFMFLPDSMLMTRTEQDLLRSTHWSTSHSRGITIRLC